MKQRFILVQAILVLMGVSNVVNAQWVQTSGPEAGNVLCFLDRITEIYAGTTGGVFVSTNRGVTWQPMNTGLDSKTIYSINVVVGVVYVGTGSSGVYSSTNRGATWTPANSGLPADGINAIDGRFEGRRLTILAGTTFNGIYRSTDGTNWTAVNNGIPPSTYIWALTYYGTDVFAGTSNGVFRSSNNGASWNASSSGLPSGNVWAFAVNAGGMFVGTDNGAFRSTNNGGSWTAATSGITNPYLYAITYTGNSGTGTSLLAGGTSIFHTTNNGANWTEAQTGLSHIYVNALYNGDGASILAGTYGGVYKTTNNGANWTRNSTGIISSSVLGFARNGNVTLAAGDNGIFLTTNAGATWVSASQGIENNAMNTIVLSGANWFASGNGYGIFRSVNNGTSWTAVNSGLNLSVRATALHGTTLFAATPVGIFRTTNEGASWDSANTGLTNRSARVLLSDGTNLFVGTNIGIFRSTNNGTLWSPASTGLPTTTIYALASSGSHLFAGTGSSGVYLSTDNGGSWTEVNAGLTTTLVRSLYVYGPYVFAGLSGNYLGAICISSNNGTSWSEVGTGLPISTVNTMTTDGVTLLAGMTSGGVWRRTLSEILPAGAVTRPVTGTGLINFNNPSDTTATTINVMAITGSGSVTVTRFSSAPVAPTFSATPPLHVSQYRWQLSQTGISTFTGEVRFNVNQFSAGITSPSTVTIYWRSTEGTGTFASLATTYNAGTNELRATISDFGEYIFGSDNNPLSDVSDGGQQIADVFHLYQNYPNPFNPSTLIRYALPKKARVKVSLFNTIGQQIQVLVDESQQAGYHEVKLNANSLASGVYLYRIEADEFVQTKKLVLLK